MAPKMVQKPFHSKLEKVLIKRKNWIPRCNLTRMEVGDPGAEAVKRALANKAEVRIEELCMTANDVGDVGVESLGLALKQDAFMKRLILDENRITVSGIRALLCGLSGNKTLLELKLASNCLDVNAAKEFAALWLDSTSSSILQKLDLRSNDLKAEGAVVLARALPHAIHLCELSVAENAIGVSGAQAIAEVLPQCSLRCLNVFGNDIGPQGVASLAEQLLKSKLLMLDVTGNGLGYSGTQSLAEALEQERCPVKELMMASNQIDSAGAAILAESLTRNENLEDLYLGANNIGAVGAKAFANALTLNNALKGICLRSNDLGDEGAEAFGTHLPDIKVLQRLGLPRNAITDKGAQLLATGLLLNKSIRDVNLHRNDIGDDGAKHIAQTLMGSNRAISRIECLQLGRNQIGEAGAKHIAEALKSPHMVLKELHIHKNQIDYEGGIAIAEALKHNQALEELLLNGNRLWIQAVQALETSMHAPNNRCLRVLDLGNSQLGVVASRSVANILKSCKELEGLHFRRNEIGDSGAIAIAYAVGALKNLTELDLSGNGIGNEGAIVLAKELLNCSAYAIDLDHNKIEDDGAKALADFVEHKAGLGELGLRENPLIRASAAKKLKQAAWNSLSLPKIRVGCDAFPVETDPA